MVHVDDTPHKILVPALRPSPAESGRGAESCLLSSVESTTLTDDVDRCVPARTSRPPRLFDPLHPAYPRFIVPPPRNRRHVTRLAVGLVSSRA